DIGSVKDYWEVLQSVLMGEVAQLHVPGTQIADGVWAGLNTSIDWSEGTCIEGPVYIGSGCRIEAGATIIGPTWIGHGSHVCGGAEVVRSVLFEYTRVLPDVVLDEMIVFKDYSVDRAGEMRHVSDYATDAWGNARDRRSQRRAEMPPARYATL
ncbi:MAG: NDP-sugar synthase, partial [Janthinobacterium sp.]